jgi:glycosyltransferase involved in cell wall biosynthesis
MIQGEAAKGTLVRILLVTPPWIRVPPAAYGGIELVVSGLADGLVAAGHDVTLVAPGGSATRAELESVFDGPMFEHLGDPRIATVNALSAYRMRHEFDVIHDHTAAVGPALGAVADGPPVIHTLHHPWDDVQAELARLVSPPVRLVAISRNQAAQAPDDVTITAVVYNGLPVERYPFSVEKDDYLLWVGRSSPDKGPTTAIEVAHRLSRPLVMIIKVNQRDEHEYWQQVLDPAIRSSAVQVEVVQNAGHEEKTELMARAAVLLVPIAWDEPFGLVMPEANACGTPAVAFARGAASEVIADGTTGFVVPAGDVTAFCSATERAVTLDPGACRRHVEERFSSQRMVAGYERAYEMVTTIDLREGITVVL